MHKFTWLRSLALMMAGGIVAGGNEPQASTSLEWSNDQLIVIGGTGRRVSAGGKECLAAQELRFDVRDEYAFDIDETVWLDIEFYLQPGRSKLGVLYARNDAAPPSIGLLIDERHREIPEIQLPGNGNGQLHRRSIPLTRARFANYGTFGPEDFALYGLRDGSQDPVFTICTISLRRAYTTPVPKAFARVSIEVADENGRPAPARMGIYDASGRLPLPADSAVALRTVGDASTRIIGLGYGVPSWPVENRSVFYTAGRYDARLPAGSYELIVAKGPEHRMTRRRFTVSAGTTKKINVRLRRWADMAATGWYSGEGHIHYTRLGDQDDHELLLFTEAEDLRVASVLQVGDSATDAYFGQHTWQPVPAGNKAPFVLVSGQEDPRTTRLGHSMQLNIKKPVRDPAHYLLYYKTFEKVRAQGGLTGYGHVVEPGWGEAVTDARGMAVDVPFGLVDFAEILVFHHVGGQTWFDFLNLGYKISPTAGSDYPAGVVPGAVRNYVRVDEPFTPQAWFDGLKRGRTFVTSGPMLDMTINDSGMGSEIRVKSGEPLVIDARAVINPDIDSLSSLELIEQGDEVKVVTSKTGATEMELRHALKAAHGTWFVLRARGTAPYMAAMSAPIYVVVDGQSFWKCAAVPSIADKMKLRIREIFEPNQVEMTGGRTAFAKHWHVQQRGLEERADQAIAEYEELARRALASITDSAKVVPAHGLEPWTYRLRSGCSTN